MNALALGTSIVGQVSQGIANRQAGTAAIAGGKAEATSEELAAEYNAQRSLTKDKLTIAKGRAVEGATGLSTTSGTPLDIALYSAMQAEMDANAIRYQGKTQANYSRARGEIVGQSFQQRGTSEFLKAGTAAVAGSSAIKPSTASTWLDKYGPSGKGKFDRPPSLTSASGDWQELVKGKFTISG